MRFMKLHQKGKPVLIAADSIRQIHVDLTGLGIVVVTDMGQSMLFDETQDTIQDYLVELEIEVDIVSNDH